VDKKIDLNIYKERDGKELAASCCVPSLEDQAQTEARSCSAPSSCCSTEPDANTRDAKASLKAVADLDFNEWVSKYHRCSPLNDWVMIDQYEKVHAPYTLSSQEPQLRRFEPLCRECHQSVYYQSPSQNQIFLDKSLDLLK
jgi:hypothetical protein